MFAHLYDLCGQFITNEPAFAHNCLYYILCQYWKSTGMNVGIRTDKHLVKTPNLALAAFGDLRSTPQTLRYCAAVYHTPIDDTQALLFTFICKCATSISLKYLHIASNCTPLSISSTSRLTHHPIHIHHGPPLTSLKTRQYRHTHLRPLFCCPLRQQKARRPPSI